MNIVGLRNEPIGELERFEIDRNGVLTGLIVRLGSSLGATRRIAADRIRGIERGRVRVTISHSELRDAGNAPSRQSRRATPSRSSA